MNKALLPLVDEDANFGDVAPFWFGPGFTQKSTQAVFSTRPPNNRGGYTRKSARRNPDCPERKPSSSGEDAPKELVEQVTHAHTFLNTMIINWKSTLLNQIARLRVECIYQPDLPQAGRLAYH